MSAVGCELTVVVVSWNTRSLTLACLASVLEAVAERDDAPAVASEVFLVDNGSADGTAEAVRERFPSVIVLALASNLGFARANNLALQRARGRSVLLLNSDARIDGLALRRCLAPFDADAGVAAVGPQLVHPDGTLQNSVHAFPSLWTELLPRALLEWLWPRRFPSKRSVGLDPIEVEAVQGAALFLRRSALVDAGLLPEAYFFFLEETSLCLRLRERAGRVLHLPAVRVVHGLGQSSKAIFPVETAIEYHRSLYRFLEEHRGPGLRRLAQGLRTLRAGGSLLLQSLSRSSAARARRTRNRALLSWHLRGCPEGPGLRNLPSTTPGERGTLQGAAVAAGGERSE